MQVQSRWIIAAAVLLSLAGCDKDVKSAGATTAKPVSATAAAPAPSGPKRITLKDLETKRLGIELAEVTKSGERLTMPYNALLYDPTGGEWAFANPEGNVYHRTALKVEAIEGDKVYLTSGPAVGTKVVTMGAAELYGIEFGVGK